MRTSITLLSLTIGLVCFAQQPADTYLDPAYGAMGGYSRIDVQNQDFATAILRDGNQAIVSFVSINGPSAGTRILKFNNDGSEDMSFGTGGELLLSVAGGSLAVMDMAWTPSGNIILGGRTSPAPFGADLYLAQITPSGSLDPSFGVNGEWSDDLGGVDVIRSLVVDQSNGEVIAVGDSDATGVSDAFALKLDITGSYVSAFGNNGVATYATSTYDYLLDAELDQNGGVLAAGSTGDDASAIRFSLSTGSLVSGFGVGGKLTIPAPVTQFGTANEVEVEDNLKVYIRYTFETGGGPEPGLIKVNTSDGSTDPVFDQNGQTANAMQQQSPISRMMLPSSVAFYYILFGTDEEKATLIGGNQITGDQALFESVPPPAPVFSWSIPGSTVSMLHVVEDSSGHILFAGHAIDTLSGNQDLIVGRVILGGLIPDPSAHVQTWQGSQLPMSVTPNPVRDEMRLNFVLDETPKDAHIQVYSITGKLMLDRGLSGLVSGSNSVVIYGLDVLSSGTYLLKLIGGGSVRTVGFQRH